MIGYVTDLISLVKKKEKILKKLSCGIRCSLRMTRKMEALDEKLRPYLDSENRGTRLLATMAVENLRFEIQSPGIYGTVDYVTGEPRVGPTLTCESCRDDDET